jgi:hypothetical protein
VKYEANAIQASSTPVAAQKLPIERCAVDSVTSFFFFSPAASAEMA